MTVTALAACGGGAGGEANADGVHKWDYYIFYPATHPVAKLAQSFADDVKTATNGDVQIKVRPAGQMPIQPNEALQAVRNGSVQIADAYTGFVAGDAKFAGVIGLPMLATSNEEGATMIDTLSDDIKTELGAQGAQELYHFDTNMQVLVGKGDPVEDPSGMDGKKIRTSSPQQVEYVKEVGGFPTTLATADVAQAWSTGAINAVLTSPQNAVGTGWNDFADWIYNVGVNPGVSFVVVNSKALADLTEEDQKAVLDVSAEYQTSQNEAMHSANEDAIEELKKGGTEVIEPTDADIAELREKLSPYWEKWATDNKATELVDAVESALGVAP